MNIVRRLFRGNRRNRYNFIDASDANAARPVFPATNGMRAFFEEGWPVEAVLTGLLSEDKQGPFRGG